jgi:hypothetical protein
MTGAKAAAQFDAEMRRIVAEFAHDGTLEYHAAASFV